MLKRYKKNFLYIILTGLVTACSSSQPSNNIKMVYNKEMFQMNRQEVINAIEDCKSANLRPVLFYSKRYVNDKPIPMIADITCAPKSGY